MLATARTSVYTANNPLGELLVDTPTIAEYVTQLRDRPFRANDKRVSNKRLLFIYDGIVTIDVGEAIQTLSRKVVITVHDKDHTYVAIDFCGTYVGSIDSFVMNGLAPHIKTIYQSEWNHVYNYFSIQLQQRISKSTPQLQQSSMRQVTQRSPLQQSSMVQVQQRIIPQQIPIPSQPIAPIPIKTIPQQISAPSQPMIPQQIPVPSQIYADLLSFQLTETPNQEILVPTQRPTWVEDVLALQSVTPNSRTIHWYHEPIGNTGKTRLADYIEEHNDRWLVINNLDEAYSLISKKLPQGIILDLDRIYDDDPLIYRIITSIKDGRMSHKGVTIRFRSPHLVVLANWSPIERVMSSDRLKVVEITQSWL